MLATRNGVLFWSTTGTSFLKTVGGGSKISETFVDPHGVNGRFDIWRIKNSCYRHRGNIKLTASHSHYFQPTRSFCIDSRTQVRRDFLEEMEPRVPTGNTKPIKMDKETKDGFSRRPCGDKGGQYAVVAVATRENSDGTRRKGRCNPSRQHPDLRHSRGIRRSDEKCQKVSKIMFQFKVLLAVANTNQAVPIMAEPPVKVGPLPHNFGNTCRIKK